MVTLDELSRFKSWVHKQSLSKQEKRLTIARIATLAWAIWMHRNKTIFKHQSVNYRSVVVLLRRAMRDLLQSLNS